MKTFFPNFFELISEYNKSMPMFLDTYYIKHNVFDNTKLRDFIVLLSTSLYC